MQNLPIKIQLIWFLEKIVLEIDQPQTRIAYGAYVCQRIGIK